MRVAVLPLLGLLAACGGPAAVGSVSTEDGVDGSDALLHPAETRHGTLLLSASVAPTAALSDTIAARYRIDRHPRNLLLLVSLSRAEAADGGHVSSLSGRIEGEVGDLRGVRRPLALREIRNGDLIDHVAEIRVTPPDTLTFDLHARTIDGERVRLRFSRDLPPPAR